MARPLLFETPEDLQKAIDKFFDDLKKPPTVEGLALALKTSRQTLLNYEGRDYFADILEDAKLRIADSVMGRAMAGEINPTIAIWISKNHYGYSDTHVHAGDPGAPLHVITGVPRSPNDS